MENFPRQARIIPSVWERYGYRFVEMGLPKPEFQAIDVNQGQVVVSPADLSHIKKDGPFTVGREFVEFPES